MRALSLMVIQYVHEMSRAVAFYRDAMGLQVISESPGWSMLSCGDALVGLHVIEPGMSEGLATYAGLSLEVQDLEVAIADIRKAGGSLRSSSRARTARSCSIGSSGRLRRECI